MKNMHISPFKILVYLYQIYNLLLFISIFIFNDIFARYLANIYLWWITYELKKVDKGCE